MYRRAAAAAGAGLTPKALHNWVSRYDLDLFEARPKQGWRTFSENDVLVLSAAVPLVRHGCPVARAVEGVRLALGDTNFRTWENRPDFIWAAENNGEWVITNDERLVDYGAPGGMADAVVRVAVPICFRNARARLQVASAKPVEGRE